MLERNPFEVIDIEGVGDLMRIARRAGQGDEARDQARASAASTAASRRSIAFCHSLGLDYVCCSPFRVPLARLAAAQAALAESGSGAYVAAGG